MPLMSIVIPVYYNGLNLPETIPQLLALETKLPGYSLQLIFVDDGSGDNSFDILLISQHEHPDKIKVVKLTRNFGSMAAIQAGFTQADGDCVGIIAADLQDPPELFIEMAEYWEKGIKSIFAVRQDREEPFTQKLFSNTYYALMKKFAIPNYPTGGFDFLLVDRQVIEEINKVHEKNTNLLSLIYWLCFKSILIPYVRRSRKKGKSRWTLKKKMKLLVDSFVSFSYFPIQFLSVVGFLVAVAAFGYGTFVFYFWLVYGIEVKGWVPLIVLLAFTSGIQMTMLGILGEYLWRTLDEARKRPVYVIDEIYTQNSETRSSIPKNPSPEGKNS
jgi:glycosyltransferase involved in cell wall biosynthesis